MHTAVAALASAATSILSSPSTSPAPFPHATLQADTALVEAMQRQQGAQPLSNNYLGTEQPAEYVHPHSSSNGLEALLAHYGQSLESIKAGAEPALREALLTDLRKLFQIPSTTTVELDFVETATERMLQVRGDERTYATVRTHPFASIAPEQFALLKELDDERVSAALESYYSIAAKGRMFGQSLEKIRESANAAPQVKELSNALEAALGVNDISIRCPTYETKRKEDIDPNFTEIDIYAGENLLARVIQGKYGIEFCAEFRSQEVDSLPPAPDALSWQTFSSSAETHAAAASVLAAYTRQFAVWDHSNSLAAPSAETKETVNELIASILGADSASITRQPGTSYMTVELTKGGEAPVTIEFDYLRERVSGLEALPRFQRTPFFQAELNSPTEWQKAIKNEEELESVRHLASLYGKVISHWGTKDDAGNYLLNDSKVAEVKAAFKHIAGIDPEREVGLVFEKSRDRLAIRLVASGETLAGYAIDHRTAEVTKLNPSVESSR